MKKNSYEKAILHSNLLQDWHGKNDATESDKALPPKHIGSPNGKPAGIKATNSNTHVPGDIPHIPEVNLSTGRKEPNVQKGANVVMCSPEKIHVGFNPPLESTNPADLPGNPHRDGGDHAVITTPPYSMARTTSPISRGSGESRPRAESIEEADRRRVNYVPGLAKQALDFVGRGPEAEPYCLDFSAFVRGSGGGKQRSYSDSGHGDSIFNVRKSSVTPSDVSTISVSTLLSSLCV